MKSAFLRRGELVRWLVEECGFRKGHVRTMIETGAVVAMKLPGRENGRAIFSRAQVERDVLGGLMK